MEIATWNVNSIRTRLDHVVNWLQHHPVDLLCLQETKVIDEAFPRSPLEALGYHIVTSGQKAYNGVAILSRSPLEEVSRGFSPLVAEESVGDLNDQKRVITGIYQGVQVVNIYVPNGSAVGSDKYAYKLRWLNCLRLYLEALLHRQGAICLCGDFNIALEDRDIHDPTGRENHIMATDLERQSLRSILSLGFADPFRKFTEEGGHFSWWDYRAASFRRNRGWRIDHHYLTPTLQNAARHCTIDTAPRALPQPSDHAPVVVTL